jgi:hypothetical protein
MKRNKKQTIANRRSKTGSYHEKVKRFGVKTEQYKLSNGEVIKTTNLK